jgi:hypothetical protein
MKEGEISIHAFNKSRCCKICKNDFESCESSKILEFFDERSEQVGVFG